MQSAVDLRYTTNSNTLESAEPNKPSNHRRDPTTPKFVVISPITNITAGRQTVIYDLLFLNCQPQAFPVNIPSFFRCLSLYLTTPFQEAKKKTKKQPP